MNLPEIRRLAEAHTARQLNEAAQALENGQALPFEVLGVDEGEKLTHLLSAAEIVAEHAATGQPVLELWRAFARRVRGVLTDGTS